METRQQAGARAARAGMPFDVALRAFEQGPPHGKVATGRVLASHSVDGVDHPYLVLVPDNYDPDRAYPVRFYLHGGVSRAEIPPNGGWWRNTERLKRDDVIAVIPASWGASTWWRESQLRSLRGISRYRTLAHLLRSACLQGTLFPLNASWTSIPIARGGRRRTRGRCNPEAELPATN